MSLVCTSYSNLNSHCEFCLMGPEVEIVLCRESAEVATLCKGSALTDG